MSEIKLIATHNGSFHADEVLATAVLQSIYPDSKLIRSRNPELLKTADIIYDVGGGKFDHHTTNKRYRENEIAFAAAGLIWEEFGKQLLQTFTTDEESIDFLHQRLDERLFQGIDALDNGQDLVKDKHLIDLSKAISTFNPTWDSQENEDEAFQKAVNFISPLLINMIKNEISKIKGKAIVENAFKSRKNKGIVILPQYCPWVEHLLTLDELQEVLFIVYPDKSNHYRIQVVTKSPESFESRKPLPESWAGKEGEELNVIIGINDAIFCHPARFIAGAKSFDSILKMAIQALES